MPQNSPLISVIIPLFNREEYIIETIDSVIAQTYTHWELIIVDDGSTDNSYQTVETKIKGDNRISLFKRNREPKGAPTCRNIGLEKSKGEYIQFLDSDDLLHPQKLEKQIAVFASNRNLDFVGCQSIVFLGETTNIVREWSQIPAQTDSHNKTLSYYLSSQMAWQTAAPLWSRTFLENNGAFNEKLSCSQEWEIHGRALTLSQHFLFLPDSLVFFRANSEGAMGREFTLKPQRESLFLATTLVWEEIKNKKLTTPQVYTAYRITSFTLMIIFIQERLDSLLNKAFIELLDTKPFLIKLKYLILLFPIFSIHAVTGKGKNHFIKQLKRLQAKEKNLYVQNPHPPHNFQ